MRKLVRRCVYVFESTASERERKGERERERATSFLEKRKTRPHFFNPSKRQLLLLKHFKSVLRNFG